MEYSVILRLYVLWVMGIVEKCIGRIKMLEKLENLMYEFGEWYMYYNVRYDFVDVSSL